MVEHGRLDEHVHADREIGRPCRGYYDHLRVVHLILRVPLMRIPLDHPQLTRQRCISTFEMRSPSSEKEPDWLNAQVVLAGCRPVYSAPSCCATADAGPAKTVGRHGQSSSPWTSPMHALQKRDRGNAHLDGEDAVMAEPPVAFEMGSRTPARGGLKIMPFRLFVTISSGIASLLPPPRGPSSYLGFSQLLGTFTMTPWTKKKRRETA